MNFQSYSDYFEKIIADANPNPPYDNPEYIDYTKLNLTRMNRWLKHGKISDELKDSISQITAPQTWIIITEPWCGDAAHIIPFFELSAKLNPLIQTDYELRDSPPYRIEQYLTNGKSKSIPILIVKDVLGKDIFHWGSRPADARRLYTELRNKHADPESIHVALQAWYNEDRGHQLQSELAALLREY